MSIETRFSKRFSVGLAMTLSFTAISISVLVSRPDIVESTRERHSVWKPEISPMGKYARGDEPIPVEPFRLPAVTGVHRIERAPSGFQGNDQIVNNPLLSPDFQTETTIAKNGNQIVVGFNDARGFTNLGTHYPATSLSGYAYSSDGGATWTDGGQLPLQTSTDKVWGDPDVKTWTDTGSGQKYFFYSSIYVNNAGENSLCIHVSSDGGVSWTPPREISTAASAIDFPDKPFMDVDPETGRIFVSWTNFGSSVTMRITYSDDMGLTWNGPVTFGVSGQGSVPRADGASNFVYLVWRNGSDIVFALSNDNGTTWASPATIVANLSEPMNPYGSDRIHGFPSMDIEDATGNVYIVYAARQLPPDFSDVYFISSVDNGSTWSSPVAINTDPGNDRSQFFPWITCDAVDKGISVIWYDQILGSGTSDITDVFHTHSIDAGASWDCPTPITDIRFHAELGNTTSQPNLGDYIQAVYEGGDLYSAFGRTEKNSIFEQPPDCYFDHSSSTPQAITARYLGLNFNDYGCTSGNGYWESGETVDLYVTIENYSACTAGITGITGALTTSSPYITINSSPQSFGNLGGPGTTSSNYSPFVLVIDPLMPCGDEIEFVLNLSSASGNAVIPFTFRTGHPVFASLLDENFDGVSAPNLPAGWTTINVTGTANPWETSTTYSSTGPNSAYCTDISSTSLNELVSPSMYIPPGTKLVDVQFNVTHNIELDNERKAWDGALMKMRVEGKDYLAGSFSSLFEPFYPWQMNRQQSTDQPLQDLSCWASDVTPNFTHVHIQYPYLAGLNIQLVFSMGTDAFYGTGSGMFADDVRVQYITYGCDCSDPPSLAAVPSSVSFTSVPVNQTTCDTILIFNNGPTSLNISSISGCSMTPFSIDTTMTNHIVLPYDTTMMEVCVTPTGAGPDTCNITIASNDPAGPAIIPVTLQQVTGAGDSGPPLLSAISVAPNPFTSRTRIGFSLPERMPVTVEIWSVTGRKVKTLAREKVLPGGPQGLDWKGRNERGEPVASGVYFIRMKTPAGNRKARMVLLK